MSALYPANQIKPCDPTSLWNRTKRPINPAIKRKRRTNAEMAELFNAVGTVLTSYGNDRISIRHLCYRLAGAGIIPKTERAFGQLGEHLVTWRKQGLIPFGRFVDATRWYHGSTTFDNAADALEDSISGYRKNLWRTQPFHVEVWVEKEAVASIVVPVADSWGIKTFVCRGFTSLTSTWEAAEIFKQALSNGKEPIILYLGDYDESGVWCGTTIQNHFKLHGLDGQVEFVRVAINQEQIHQFNLPTRPPKERKGSKWVDRCVEIDTLSSAQIRELLENEITSSIESEEWNRLRVIEQAEQETLEKILVLHRDELEGAA